MKLYIGILALALSLAGFARADEIQFTTLPPPIQTSVIRETHISDPSMVTRVVRDEGGVYAVTVRANDSTRVVYVNDSGAIVQAPSSTTTTTTTTTERAEPVVTYEQVQQDQPRYQLIEKKGNKEVYMDRQTGQKVKVKRENGD
jgi:hypothetical protein